MVEGVGVLYFGNEHVSKTLRQRGIGNHRRIESRCGIEQAIVAQFQRYELMGGFLVGMPFPEHTSAKLNHLEIVGAFHKVDIEGKLRPIDISAGAFHDFWRQHPRDVEIQDKPQFVGINILLLSAALGTRLPLVGASEVCRKAFCPTPVIFVRESQLEARSNKAI